MKLEIIGHSLKIVKSTISTKINMGSSRPFPAFIISSAIYYQIED